MVTAAAVNLAAEGLEVEASATFLLLSTAATGIGIGIAIAIGIADLLALVFSTNTPPLNSMLNVKPCVMKMPDAVALAQQIAYNEGSNSANSNSNGNSTTTTTISAKAKTGAPAPAPGPCNVPQKVSTPVLPLLPGH
jgi:hypothetical protein